MDYKIIDTSRDRWLSVARDCPYATYFHTPYWYDIIAPDQEHVPIEIAFEDGASAIIPIARIKRFGGLVVDHFSSPGGTYGGWISSSPLSEEHIKCLMDILASHDNLSFRVNHLDGRLASFVSSQIVPTSMRVKKDFSHILDLTQGEQRLLEGMTKDHRYAIRRAVRDGVMVKADESAEEWEQYYGLYRSSVDRWRAGGPKLKPKAVYPPSLFQRVCDNNTGNEILWLAKFDGETIAGTLVFYWNRHVVMWSGAALSERFNLKPNNLLYWEVIRDALRRGYEIFDFNPSGGYSGVESFKERFGTVRVQTPVLSTRSPLRSLVSRLRSSS